MQGIEDKIYCKTCEAFEAEDSTSLYPECSICANIAKVLVNPLITSENKKIPKEVLAYFKNCAHRWAKLGKNKDIAISVYCLNCQMKVSIPVKEKQTGSKKKTKTKPSKLKVVE